MNKVMMRKGDWWIEYDSANNHVPGVTHPFILTDGVKNYPFRNIDGVPRQLFAYGNDPRRNESPDSDIGVLMRRFDIESYLAPVFNWLNPAKLQAAREAFSVDSVEGFPQ